MMALRPTWPVALLTCLTGCRVALAVLSLGWHMNLDASILLDAGFLIDRQQLVPYRDFFEMNVPGVYAANVVVGRVFGYTGLGFRCADLLLIMRRYGRLVGW